MMRRFGAYVYFGRPEFIERERLWKQLIPPGFRLVENIAYERLRIPDVTGANISSIYKYCVTEILAEGECKKDKEGLIYIDHPILFKAIKREMLKENRVLRM
jgi:hypothetical protein